MNYMPYTQKELMNKVKPRHNGGYRLDLQINGVRKTFYSQKSGDSGRRECARKALSWFSNDNVSNRYYTVTTDNVFQSFFKSKELVTSDVYNLRNFYKNHIRPIIGDKPILQLTKQDLRDVVNSAYAKDLSSKTLKNIRGVLSGFCLYIEESNIRSDLSVRGIKIPKGAKKSQKQTLTAVGIYIVFSRDYTIMRGKEVYDDLVNAYRLGIALGLRPGEIMGLEWGDITDNHIHIQRSINAKGKTTGGKNEYAPRYLPQTKFTRAIFALQAEYRTTKNPHERVFGDYEEITYCDRWKRYCKYNGIPYITPYELRHTFASVYKNRLSTWDLDGIMGHAHSGVSLGVYAHPMDGDSDGVVEILEHFLEKQYQQGKKEYLAQTESKNKNS